MAAADKLAERSTSIIVNFYTGIINAVPGILVSLRDADRVHEYYKERVADSVQKTGNATTIFPGDEAFGAVRLKLQEEHIPFVIQKTESLAAPEGVSGFYAFVLQPEDYRRAKDICEELEAHLNREPRAEETAEHSEGPEEEDPERAREDGDAVQEEEEPEAGQEATDGEAEEEPEEEPDEEEENGRQAKSKKKESDRRDNAAYQEPGREKERDVYQEDESRRDKERREEGSARREEARRREDAERRTADERRKERDRADREDRARRLQLDESRRRSETERLNAEERRRQEETRSRREEAGRQGKAESREGREPSGQKDGNETRREQSERQERERKNTEPSRSQAGSADRNKEADFRTHEVLKGKSVSEARQEDWIRDGRSPADAAGSSTGSRKKAASGPTEGQDPYRRETPGARRESGVRETLGASGQRSNETYVQEKQKASADTARQEERRREEKRSEEIRRRASGRPDQERPSSRNRSGSVQRRGFAGGGQDVAADFKHKSAQHAGPENGTAAGGVTCIATASDYLSRRQGSSEGYRTGRMGGSVQTGSMSSRQSDVLTSNARQAGPQESRKAVQDGSSKFFEDRERYYSAVSYSKYDGRENSGGKWNRPHPNINNIRKLESSDLNETYIKQKRIKRIVSKSEKFANRLKYRNALRAAMSPDNYKVFIRQTRRTIASSVVSRDTEAGQVANEIVDFASPAARCITGNYLKSGAVSIARNTHCNMEVLTSAYSVKNGISMNQGRSELMELRRWDANSLRTGGTGLNMANDGMMMDRLREMNLLSGKSGDFLSFLQKMSDQEFSQFLKNLGCNEELMTFLLSRPRDQLDVITLSSLIKRYGRSAETVTEHDLLKMIYASKMQQRYRGGGGTAALFRRYMTQALKRAAGQSEAGRAFGSLYNAADIMYATYRSGVRLLMNVAERMRMDPNSLAFRMMYDPGGVLMDKFKKEAKKGIDRAAKAKGNSVASRFARSLGGSLKRARSAEFLNKGISTTRKVSAMLKPSSGVSFIMSKLHLTPLFTKVSETIAAIAAKASVLLGWVAVIAVVVVILLSLYQNLVLDKIAESAPKNYNFAQQTEIVQEVISELTAKNEAFMTEINNAANHRGNYSSNVGYGATQSVDQYQQGAYAVVFRDAYRDPNGNPIELDPTHVDLNNTKAILSMAAKFMPYPFQKLSENASEEQKMEYEELKQHFKDYCNFLWASTHQISIEEYQPSDPEYSQYDNSGLDTIEQNGRYVCEMEGTEVWRKEDFSRDYTKKGQACESCSEENYTAFGDYLDDLCFHGMENLHHGGWEKTSESRDVWNCDTEHHCSECSYYDADNHYVSVSHQCGEGCGRQWDVCKHKEYKWVYHCGGHLGVVVYVTIGDLSRMPGFPEAGDVDYNAVGQYDTGDPLLGSDVSTGTVYKGSTWNLPEDELRWIAAACVAENGTASNAVRFEVSLMCNLAEKDGRGLYEYIRNSGWFAQRSINLADREKDTVSDSIVEIVRDVICNGNRSTQADEHDSFKDIVKIENNGHVYEDEVSIKNRSNYVPGVTKIYNDFGSIYIFECFPSANSDPFGKKIGDWK